MNPRWFLKDTKFTKDKGKVFTTFGSGGGSTLGYKLAGYDVIAYNDIDPKMAEIYVKNHNPKYVFLEDIRELNKPDRELPKELYDIDILDGSPPCTSFSMAGIREEGWGKEKKYREGQVSQTLDDLFFEFIKLAEKIKPKIIVAENVKGMLAGNAKPYVKEIYERLDKIGYNVQLFLVNTSDFGVPQRRERVVFICSRKDLNLPKFELNNPKTEPLTYGDIQTDEGILNKINENTKVYELWKQRLKTDKDLGSVNQRVSGKVAFFGTKLYHKNTIPPTIVANDTSFQYDKPYKVSSADMITIQTFPQDYDFIRNTMNNITYTLGMSVPPFLYKHIGEQIYEQWLK